MASSRSGDEQFLKRLRQIIDENISNEQFGVSDLAREIGMSRSNLLRKVTKSTNQSVSQFIRQIRLEKASELLKSEPLTVSEVSYRVGFGSPSYFIKCFREHYGYPPGSIGDEEPEAEQIDPVRPEKKRKIPVWILSLLPVIVIVITIILIFKPWSFRPNPEKSIAVLPFINDSSDSSNVYIINGLMESTLNKLQGIDGLRVISRTSAEKYRDHSKTIPEIAKELNVEYIVEGSGQKIGDEISLVIQLIEAKSDNHLWSQQFQRKATDIFELQNEIALKIVQEVQVIVTPDEQERLEKIPTENLEAYDEFLKGIDLLNKPDQTKENIYKSISFFRKAIKLDTEFARAYAATALAYYLVEDNKVEKEYADSINYFADKALFYDSNLPQSLIAKALYYISHYEPEQAVPYLNKALEINPNYDLVYVFLVDLYSRHIPNTEKYLEYALRGLQVDPTSYDSISNSFNYLHISNAFIQAGFVEQAEKYINRSLDYMPDNLYSEYVKAYILYAKNKDLQQLREDLLTSLQKDPTRIDILQELAKVCYFQHDYEVAYHYYQNFLSIKNTYNLDIYPQEDVKIANTCLKLNKDAEAQQLLDSFKAFVDQDHSIYKSMNLCLYYSATGEKQKALEQLNLFTEEKNFHYWTILFMPVEPLMDDLRSDKEYTRAYKKLQRSFQEFHDRIEKSLSAKGLLN
ncbi:MAG TPA: helix-turn-helix domain-containing protein [Draconibacterium sp.]|nr:helix-turn-helix domain-containing protein [Draconibacterium sp.]